jgi:aminoglycoside 3-N-acetyltransferase
MTRGELDRLMEGLGLRSNHLVVHASLSSFGQIDGGARTVCEALVDAVGDAGTVLMPAFTYAETLSDFPNGVLRGRPVAFHQDLPVSREIGEIAEAFRHLPGVMRSSHPTHSFAAWGRQAREVLSTQRDNNPLGPLKKLNVVQGQVLLLGTSLASATAVHLSEERLGAPYLRSRRTAVRVNAAGYDERVVLDNIPGCSGAFVRLEEHLDPTKVRSAPLARGAARKIPIRYLVNLATAVLERDPHAFICERPDCVSCAAKREALGASASSALG